MALKTRIAALAVFVSGAALSVSPLDAACFVPAGTDSPAPRLFPPDAGLGPDQFLESETGHSGPAVGLWRALFRTDDGLKYDETFQTIQAGGTEMMVSNGLPPVLGNVCVGAWKRAGGTIKILHTTWNWNPDNTFAGTFVMLVRIRVDRNGRAYSGRWSARNFDPDGNHLSDLDAQGVVTATRVSVD